MMMIGNNGVQSPDYTELGGEDNNQIDNDNDEKNNNLGDNIVNSNNDNDDDDDEQKQRESETIHKKSLIKVERDFFEFPQAGQ